MSKHLPPPDKTTSHTDFSTDALLKAQQRSTIQWIGALQQPGASLPASTLLRQLYANRESVIRANVSTRGGGGYYGPEMVGPLPTPPGSEGGTYPQVSTISHRIDRSHEISTYELFARSNQSIIFEYGHPLRDRYYLYMGIHG